MVADGAGSAKYSDIGAKLAVNTELYNGDRLSEVEKPKTSACQPWNLLGKSNKESNSAVAVVRSDSEQKLKQFFSNIVKQVTTALKEQAAKDDYSVDDLACTLPNCDRHLDFQEKLLL